MKLDFKGEISAVKDGIILLQKDMGFKYESGGREIIISHISNGFCLEIDENTASLAYATPADFYRGLSLAVNALKTKSSISISQQPTFKTIGVMIDVSRGAVMKVDTIKDFIRRMARMGYNEIMLYTEDVYEIKEYPYFGYMRGRYTEEELIEIVSYASTLGIEAVPCIQTLGHLRAPLRWSAFSGIKDQPDILMIGEEKSYLFIEEMIKTVRRIFKTRKVHIGMDEAHGVGLGNYLLKNGFRDRFTILSEHLHRVLDICKKYDFEPMMWSDMFFRLGTPNGGYYSEEACLPENIASLIPDGVSQVYWDYYNNDEKLYNVMIGEHKKMGCPVIFAGAIWTSNGPAANISQPIDSIVPALKICREQGIKDVFVCLWGDDGTECDYYEALYGIQFFADVSYTGEKNIEATDKMFEICNGYNSEIFKLFDLDNFNTKILGSDYTGSEKPVSYMVNTSKQALYQNPLMGLFDKNIEKADLHSHYSKILENLEKLSIPDDLEPLVSVHRQLLKVIVSKCDIGIRLKKAYDDNDRNVLKELSKELRILENEISKLMNYRKKLWYMRNKPFGFETVLSRLATVQQLVVVAYERIEEFLNGEIDCIEELSEERLLYNGSEKTYLLAGSSKYIMMPNENL